LDLIDHIFLPPLPLFRTCSHSHVSCRTDRTIGLAQNERPSMVCASIMCYYWRRSFRRSQLAQPKRQEQIDLSAASKSVITTWKKKPQITQEKKKEIYIIRLRKKKKNSKKKKNHIDQSHKIPLTVISSYKR
jgi:hypothetical protein